MQAPAPPEIDLKIERLEVEHATPPPAEAQPRKSILLPLAIGASALASVVFVLLALAKQKERTPGLVFLGLAVLAAAVPLVAIVRTKRAALRIAKWPVAVAIVAMLGAAAFQVIDLSCTERLGPRGDLRGCDLAGQNLRLTNLTGANLREANLQGATLRTAPSANLTGANLKGAHLAAANLTGAQLTNANLDGADLQQAKLGGIEAEGATFAKAKMTGADLNEAVLNGASFAGATLTGASLSQASLAEANLRGAVLEGAVLAASSFTGADLTDARLPEAIALGADFTSATLQGANLRAGTFDEAIFEKADLRDTLLDDAAFPGAQMSGARFDGALARKTVISGGDLTRATLRNVDFTNATLSGADLQGARLSDLKLDGVSLIGTSGLTDRALAAAVGVSRADLPSYTTRHDIYLDLRSDILARLGDVRTGRGLSGTASYAGTFHPLVLLDSRGNSFDWTQNVATAGWEPTAIRFGQLVAFVTRSERVVQRCTYRSFTTGLPGSITRYRNTVRVRVLRARSGAEVLDRTFLGSNPNACPDIAPFQTAGRLEGSEVSFSKVRPALRSLVF